MGEKPIAVCSARPRPSVHKTGKGHQHWVRDVYHLTAGGGQTLCGRNCSEWLTIGPVEPDHNCCERCMTAHLHPSRAA